MFRIGIHCRLGSIYERMKVWMLTENGDGKCNVNVTARIFDVDKDEGMINVEDLSDVEPIEGVFVYRVRQGKQIQLRMKNEGEKVYIGWNRREVDVNLRNTRLVNTSGVLLNAGGVHVMHMFAMRGKAMTVDFFKKDKQTSDAHEVVLRMRFENFAPSMSPASLSSIPENQWGHGAKLCTAQLGRTQALVQMQALLEEMRQLRSGGGRLDHLGAWHRGWFSGQVYKYSIPLEIKAGEFVVTNTTVSWNVGGSLDNTLRKIWTGDDWMELRAGSVVYYKRNATKDDDYGTEDGRTADIYDLQKEIQDNAQCEKQLTLRVQRGRGKLKP